MNLSCFKAYDIRGRLDSELNEDVAYRIGRAFAEFLDARRVVVGGDIRESSEALKTALSRGIMDAGADVIDLGMTGTEEVYHAAFTMDVDGGIEVTASHNPIDFNGMKLVGRGARPISSDSGLLDIKIKAEKADWKKSRRIGTREELDNKKAYAEHMVSYVDTGNLRPLKIVVNAGNGAAGPALDAIENELRIRGVQIEFVKVHHTPDGSFPNGIPNPILPENRGDTIEAVIRHNADFGVAWDGDFDRCFLFDEKGQFIEGYYVVGLLGTAFMKKHKGAKIIHDPRLTWNTIELAREHGGEAIQSKTGHAFIKERMRKENAVYGGEMSAHHYFKQFAYCDSGMIPWLLVAELVSIAGKPLSELVRERIDAFPSSGEINRKLSDPDAALAKIIDVYAKDALSIDKTDGVSFCFEQWRFNLRKSNTEPLLRLNVETRGDKDLLEQKTAELLTIIDEVR